MGTGKWVWFGGEGKGMGGDFKEDISDEDGNTGKRQNKTGWKDGGQGIGGEGGYGGTRYS